MASLACIPTRPPRTKLAPTAPPTADDIWTDVEEMVAALRQKSPLSDEINEGRARELARRGDMTAAYASLADVKDPFSR